MTTFIKPIADESLVFPDGQPHIKVNEFSRRVVCRLIDGNDLLRLAMYVDINRLNVGEMSLEVMYLVGGRMDRSIGHGQPYTLRAVCRLINGLGFDDVSVFCPHSQATSDLLERYNEEGYRLQENCFYDLSILRSLCQYKGCEFVHGDEKLYMRQEPVTIVYPDEGADKRYKKSDFLGWFKNHNKVVLEKVREESTGRITHMAIKHGTPGECCVIIDDLCDGGATFILAAKALRAQGAKFVALAVCHGVFSKGTKIEGIDFICTTNSFKERESGDGLWVYQLS